jgi:hypothetical protein
MNADTTYHDSLDQEPCLPSLVLPCVLPMSRGVGARGRLGTARNLEEDRTAAVGAAGGEDQACRRFTSLSRRDSPRTTS